MRRHLVHTQLLVPLADCVSLNIHCLLLQGVRGAAAAQLPQQRHHLGLRHHLVLRREAGQQLRLLAVG